MVIKEFGNGESIADTLRTAAPVRKDQKRFANWDLLRTISMVAVIVVHTGPYLAVVHGINVGNIASRAAILCDPIFFVLSGFFAIRPLKSTYVRYLERKVSTIVLPLLVYSVILYVYTSWGAEISFHGYVRYFADVLSPWWFIPSLIPFLMAAPFLYWFFENIDDELFKLIAKVFCAVTIWALFSMTLSWLLGVSGHETLELAVNGILIRLIPVSFPPFTGYFAYFCLGYFFRRFLLPASEKKKNLIIASGISFWILDLVLSYAGATLADPSYPWFFATCAVMLIFSRIKIENPVVQRILEWTGRRSYSIYLLQYTTIAVSASFMYSTVLGVDATSLSGAPRILCWMILVAGAWLLALAIASIVDTTVVKFAQSLFSRIVKALPKLRASV